MKKHTPQYIPLPHVGELLFDEFMEPLNLSGNQLAKLIGVPANRINDIVRGRRGMTADTDLRLCRYFSMSEGFFLRLQNDLDMRLAKRKIAKELTRIKPRKMPKDMASGIPSVIPLSAEASRRMD
ncbi:MAG: HigA family addiction module antitoxin [Hydrotalea sp.]|nr:HigA family addiction module antitoxin [Hydrotalea sp.]